MGPLAARGPCRLAPNAIWAVSFPVVGALIATHRPVTRSGGCSVWSASSGPDHRRRGLQRLRPADRTRHRSGGAGGELGWVWLLCRDWLTWEVGDLAGWWRPSREGAGPEAAMGFVPGPLEAAGHGGTGASGTDHRARAARCRPADHNGGGACIGERELDGELLAANALAAGAAIPVGGMVVPCRRLVGNDGPARCAPGGAAAPRSTPNRWLPRSGSPRRGATPFPFSGAGPGERLPGPALAQ
jgi:hypothetical protein